MPTQEFGGDLIVAPDHDPVGLDEQHNLNIVTVVTPDRLFFSVPSQLTCEDGDFLLQSVKRNPGIFAVIRATGIRFAREEAIVRLATYNNFRPLSHAAIFSTMTPESAQPLVHAIDKYITRRLPDWSIMHEMLKILPDNS